MNTLPRPGVQILAAALGLGISADTLLRASPPGINAALWLLFLIAAVVILARRLDHPLVGGWKLVAASGILCAMSVSWRDSPVLTLFNVTGALAGCALVGMRTSSRRLSASPVFEIVHGMFVHLVHAIAGAGFLIARELIPGRSHEVRRKSPLPSLARGVALAVPFLLLFGSLFAAADASFEHLVGGLFDFDLSSLLMHILVTCFFTWIAAGFLRGSLAAEEVPVPATLRESYLSLGITEVGILLGFLDALFFLFVAMQIPYLFGGATTVAATASLTYAAYARRGFFELTAV
ncbi:MAG TPA: DUF4153 domain-containing protein, partial [Bacteroidota bacterium]|nr:DUF4153 domain-containing protein [Bacteroidota bacterium]